MKEQTARLAVLTALRDFIDAEVTRLRSDVEALLIDAHESMGVKQVAADLPNGTTVATVSLTSGGSSLYVDNEAAFVAWVAEQYPTEVVTTVRESFKKAFLASGLTEAGGAIVDPKTGEIVPGLAERSKAPYISVRFKTGGRDEVRKALAEPETARLAALDEQPAIG